MNLETYKERWGPLLEVIPGDRSDPSCEGFWTSSLLLYKEAASSDNPSQDYVLQFEVEDGPSGVGFNLSFLVVSEDGDIKLHKIDLANRHGLRPALAELCSKYSLPMDAEVKCLVMSSAIGALI